MTKVFLSVLSLILPAVLFADSTYNSLIAEFETAKEVSVKEVQAELPVFSNARFSFVQKKQIPDISRALRSEGELLIDGDSETLHWNILKPFKQSFEVKPDGFVQILSDGRRVAKKNESFKQVSSVLLSLLQQEFTKLHEVFAIKRQSESPGKTVFLVPRNGYLKQLIPWIAMTPVEEDMHITIQEAAEVYSQIVMKRQ